MAPIQASKSSSSLSQPPKGTQHKQRACKHARNKSSDPEDGKTTNKASATCKRKHDLASSADEATDSHSTTKKKKMKKKKKRSATATDTSDKGDESGDETARDQAPEDMDENEQALKKVMASWTSAVYDHYHLPPSINVEDGIIKYVFTCKRHRTTHTHAKKDTSTTNLKNHAERCDMKANSVTSKQLKITDIASQYNEGEFRLLHAEWMTQSHRPTLMIEDPKLQEIYRLLNPQVKIHSDTTLGRDIKEVYEVSKEQLKERLKEHEGRFHVAFDAWAAPNSHDYLGIVLVWCDKGQIQVVTLDLVELTEAHTGVYLAERVMEVLKEYGIEDRILGEAGDNASVNNKTLDELETLFKEISSLIITGHETQIRCFAHVLNLIVKAILSQFEAKCRVKKSSDAADKSHSRWMDNDDEESDIDEVEDDKDDLLDDEELAVLDDLQKTLEEEEDALIEDSLWDRAKVLELTDEEINTGVAALTKLLKLGKRIFHKSALQKDLANLCGNKKIPVLKMIRRVITRWNTTSNVINRGLQLRPALDALCIKSDHNRGKPPAKRLKRFRLTDVEWTVLQQLHPILTNFLKATDRISRSGAPLLHKVIPMMDILTRELEKALKNMALLPCVCAGISWGLAIIDKYYSKTDESIMWKTAMILHPRYKLDYFHSQNWLTEWVKTAEQSAREMWTRYYKPMITETVTLPTDSDDPFADVDNFGRNMEQDPFEAYIRAPQFDCGDPISHWTAKLDKRSSKMKNKPVTPAGALARMALDFLSAPAASTDVERVFSHGGLVVSKRRHNLSPESTRANVILNSWSKIDGIVPRRELIKQFNEKLCRGDAKGKYVDVIEVDDSVEDSEDNDD